MSESLFFRFFQESRKAINKYKCGGYKMKLKCTNKKCNYEWEYKGNSPFYATCPRCYRKINIQKQKNAKQKRSVSNMQ